MRLTDLLDRHPLPALGDGSKDQRASVFILGGPPTCPGAVVLAATAALRTGAGRVRVAVHPDVAAAVGVEVPELAVFGWHGAASPTGELSERLAHADVVHIGCGYTHLDEAIVRGVAARAERALIVLDAGALPATRSLARTRRVTVAPNADEARQILGLEPDDVADETTLACRLAELIEQPVAVRGAKTVIAAGEDCWEHDDNPSGLGTPGSGDVFAGVLSTLLGHLDDAAAALGWAVHLHAAGAARRAAVTPVGYRASDIVDDLPFALADAQIVP